MAPFPKFPDYDPVCADCESVSSTFNPPFDIVIECAVCRRGYHRACMEPRMSVHELLERCLRTHSRKPSTHHSLSDWKCRDCRTLAHNYDASCTVCRRSSHQVLDLVLKCAGCDVTSHGISCNPPSQPSQSSPYLEMQVRLRRTADRKATYHLEDWRCDECANPIHLAQKNSGDGLVEDRASRQVTSIFPK